MASPKLKYPDVAGMGNANTMVATVARAPITAMAAISFDPNLKPLITILFQSGLVIVTTNIFKNVVVSTIIYRSFVSIL
jgi:hypothetical protein